MDIKKQLKKETQKTTEMDLYFEFPTTADVFSGAGGNLYECNTSVETPYEADPSAFSTDSATACATAATAPREAQGMCAVVCERQCALLTTSVADAAGAAAFAPAAGRRQF